MTTLKLGVLVIVALAGAIGVVLGTDYWITSRDSLDEKGEWSILQAAYQTNKTKKADSCLPISYVYQNSKAIGFWSPQGWVWVLMPSHANGRIKVLPEGVRFYLPKSGGEEAISGIGDPSVIKYIRENSIAGCP